MPKSDERLRIVLCLSALTVVGLLQVPSDASASTPEATPTSVTAGTATCDVVPRPTSFLAPLVAELLATPAANAGHDSATQESARIESGKPAPPSVVTEVEALIVELNACTNAGDFPRLSTLFTDEAARQAVLAGWGQGVHLVRREREQRREPDYSPAELISLIVQPRPLPEADRVQVVSVSDVRELPGNRVTAIVRRSLTDGSILESRVDIERVNGELLLVAEHALTLRGTPIPWPPG